MLVRSLALERARWVLAGPTTIAGLAVALWLVWQRLAPLVPALHRDSALVASLAWPMAAGVLLSSAWLAHRPSFDGTQSIVRVSGATRLQRALAVVVAAVMVGLASLAVAVLVLAVRAVGEAAIGSVAWLDLVGVAVGVAAASLAGDAIGRVARSVAVVLIGSAALVGAFIGLVYQQNPRARLGLMVDWVRLDGGMIEMLPRAPARHLLMAACVLLALVTWTVCRRRAARVLLTVSALVAAGGVGASLVADPWQGEQATTARELAVDPLVDCEPAGDHGHEVCGPEPYRPWARELVGVVESIEATLGMTGPKQRVTMSSLTPRKAPGTVARPDPRQRRDVAVSTARPSGLAGDRWELAVAYALAWNVSQRACDPDDGELEYLTIRVLDQSDYVVASLGEQATGTRGCQARGTVDEVLLLLVAAEAIDNGEEALRSLTDDVPVGWHPGGPVRGASPFSAQLIQGTFATHDIVGDFGAVIPGVAWDEGWDDATLWPEDGSLVLSRRAAEAAIRIVDEHGLDAAVLLVAAESREGAIESQRDLARALGVPPVMTFDESAARQGIDLEALQRALDELG